MHRSASFDASVSSLRERERARSVERLADVAMTSEPAGSLPSVFTARRAGKASEDRDQFGFLGRRASKGQSPNNPQNHQIQESLHCCMQNSHAMVLGVQTGGPPKDFGPRGVARRHLRHPVSRSVQSKYTTQ